MHIAKHREKLVDLQNCERQDWQKLYVASVQQQLHCMHCGEALRMQFSIHEPPVFVHPASDFDCESVVVAYQQSVLEKQSEQVTPVKQPIAAGFTLPMRQTITKDETSVKRETSWKRPEQVEAIPPFTKKHTAAPTIPSAYRKNLEHEGILLDETQWQAVTTSEGPLLLLAGAGSGKTRVLTARAAYMMTEQGIPATKILLVTFTAKAAREMQERMKHYPGISSSDHGRLVIGTFHSIFYKILLHAEPARWASERLLKWDWQREQMVKEVGRELDLDEKEFAFDQALTQISWWKNHLLAPHEVKPKDKWEEQVLVLYKGYESIRDKLGTFDFDDMLIGCYQLLSSSPDLLARYQDRFEYISIDEFQDINKVQYALVQLLAQKAGNLCVVGDDDQSIYGFRGSDPGFIQRFEQDYPLTKKIIIAENYRSTHPIVSTANNVIKHNRKRLSKKLVAQHDHPEKPLFFYPYDEEEEATMIVMEIKKKIEAGASPGDFAVLYRTNVSARALFERIVSSNLPFQLENEGDSFYRRKAVRKVLAYLRLSQNGDDVEAMTELLAALFIKQSALQQLKALSITEDCSLVQSLTMLEGIQPFQAKKLKIIVPLFQRLQKLAPLEAISLIEKEMGLSDYLKKRGNEGNVMDRGSDDIRDLKVAAQYHDSIPSLLAHADHMIAKQEEIKKSKQSSNAIQLMTIHRAKGLEFNEVFILGANEGNLPHDFALDAWREGDDQAIEEERRLMYVAITRARKQLYISIPMMRRGKRAQRSRFTREMNRGVRSNAETPVMNGGKR